MKGSVRENPREKGHNKCSRNRENISRLLCKLSLTATCRKTKRHWRLLGRVPNQSAVLTKGAFRFLNLLFGLGFKPQSAAQLIRALIRTL